MLTRLLPCAVFALCACKSTPTLDGPCDSKQMTMLRNALANVNDEDRALITTMGLGEACESKLPGGVVEGIKAVGSVNTADRATIIAGVLSENASFANLGCADWEKNSTAAIKLEPARRSAALYASCKYDRFDLLTPAEFDASWKASGLALLAVPMYAWLVDKNMQAAEAKRLARSMIIEPPPPPPEEADAGL